MSGIFFIVYSLVSQMNLVQKEVFVKMEIVSSSVNQHRIVSETNIATRKVSTVLSTYFPSRLFFIGSLTFASKNVTAMKNVLKGYFACQMDLVQISVKITIIVQEDKYV